MNEDTTNTEKMVRIARLALTKNKGSYTHAIKFLYATGNDASAEFLSEELSDLLCTD